MCCVIKRRTWVLVSCTILLLAFVLVGAGCGDSVSKCGNGIREVTEFCDGVNLGEQSCVTLRFGGGSLGCQADCTFDTSGCTSGPVCGDNVAQALEICDGTDLAGLTCADFGFTGGTLACNATCNNVDVTGCTSVAPAGWTCPPWIYGAANGCECGCGVIDLDCADGTVASCEWCGSPGSCSPIGFDSACPGDIDPAQNWLCGGGTAVCGNDVAEVLEACDGSDLRGATCMEPGFTGGTLACNDTCNNVDITGCTSVVPAGWNCLPWFYGAADGCDCGCGVIDLDCADATVASCEWCSYPGSCSPIGSGSGCPGDIDPAQNWLCGG